MVPTVECVPQGCGIGVSVFDVVVGPPSDPFAIEGHRLHCRVDILIQLKGIYLKNARFNISNPNRLHSESFKTSLPTIEHAVCYWSTRYDWFIIVTLIGWTGVTGTLHAMQRTALKKKHGIFVLNWVCLSSLNFFFTSWNQIVLFYSLQNPISLTHLKVFQVSRQLIIIFGHTVLSVVLEVVWQTIIKEHRTLWRRTIAAKGQHQDESSTSLPFVRVWGTTFVQSSNVTFKKKSMVKFSLHTHGFGFGSEQWKHGWLFPTPV